MSADNGIFIVDHPRGYAVFEAFMSDMPHSIAPIIQSQMRALSDVHVFNGKDAKDQALAKARQMSREMYRHNQVLEYGIVNMTNPYRDYKPELHD